MGCTVREKHMRTNRRSRTAKAGFDPCCYASSISKSIPESGLKPLAYRMGLHDPNSNPNLNTSNLDENGWGYCTEEQLEEILLKNLEILYKEAICKLVSLGYDEDTSLKAILRNGHCYGGMDVLTNILHNSLAYLNSNCINSCSSSNGNLNEFGPAFNDLRQLEMYSLEGMICLLQQVRPHLSKGDAMWCLLMSDLHVGRASSIEIPMPNAPSNGNTALVQSSLESVCSDGVDGNGVGGMAPALCRFHGGWGFGNGGGLEFAVNGFFSYSAEMTFPRDIECPKRFNLSPAMKSLLKRNVAMFAAGFRANSKQMQTKSASQADSCVGVLSGGDVTPASPKREVVIEKVDDCQNLKKQDEANLMWNKFQDGISSVLNKFSELNLNENLELVGEDQKDEMIVALLHQIKELERQVKERKEWAHQKAMQAARKLSSDLTELKALRMEREETQRLKKGKQILEDSTMKRLAEMENALRKASGQVDRANASVRRLETENAEIRAEMEASKLSSSESASACLEAARREKKCRKKLLEWEKRKNKLKDEIRDEKFRIMELRGCLSMVEQAQKEAKEKWGQEVKLKEQALTQVEEERRLKEAAEASNKRKLEALHLKVEIDFQRHKDDLQRLEQELSRLKASAELPVSDHRLSSTRFGKSERTKTEEINARLLRELDALENSSYKGALDHTNCIICMKDEVSIVFLPCAHQVLCAGCSDNYGKKGKATCPCCLVPIEQRIRVFGASS